MKLDQSRLEYYITSEQADKQLGGDLDAIYQLADEGKLQAAVMTDGEVLASVKSASTICCPRKPYLSINLMPT